MRHSSNSENVSNDVASCGKIQVMSMSLRWQCWRIFAGTWMCVVWLAMAGMASASEPSVEEVIPMDPRPVLRFGIPPWQKSQSVDEIREQYRPLLEWLGTQVGYRFVVVGGRSYEDMIDLIARGNVQFAVLSPVPYVQAKRKNPELELLLTELKWNEAHTATVDFYLGYIITRKDRADLTTAADLKGKRLGFVNVESTSGWRYPNAMLLAAGLDVRTGSTALFLGSHPRVTDAIEAGSVDAGATWDFNLAEAIRKHGDVFKVIMRSPPIPNICMVAHPSVPAELRARIRTLLPTASAELFGKTPMQGYVVRPDAFYDVVRTLIDTDVIPPQSGP